MLAVHGPANGGSCKMWLMGRLCVYYPIIALVEVECQLKVIRRPHGVAAVTVVGGPTALDHAARCLGPELGGVHALSTPLQGILFASAEASANSMGCGREEADGGRDGGASGAGTMPLWRLAAAAEAIPALQVTSLTNCM